MCQPLGSDFIFLSLGGGKRTCNKHELKTKEKNKSYNNTIEKCSLNISFIARSFTIRSTSETSVISSNAAQRIFIYYSSSPCRRDGQVSTVKWERYSLVATASSTSSRQQKPMDRAASTIQARTSLITNRSTTTTVLTPSAHARKPQRNLTFYFCGLIRGYNDIKIKLTFNPFTADNLRRSSLTQAHTHTKLVFFLCLFRIAFEFNELEWKKNIIYTNLFSHTSRRNGVWRCSVVGGTDRKKNRSCQTFVLIQPNERSEKIRRSFPLLFLVKYGRPATIKNKTHETCFFHSWFNFFFLSTHFICELRARFDKINVWNIFFICDYGNDDDTRYVGYLFWAMEIFIRSGDRSRPNESNASDWWLPNTDKRLMLVRLLTDDWERCS